MKIEGSGSGSIPLTSGSGSGRPKNMWIRIRIRIRNTAWNSVPIFKRNPSKTRWKSTEQKKIKWRWIWRCSSETNIIFVLYNIVCRYWMEKHRFFFHLFISMHQIKLRSRNCITNFTNAVQQVTLDTASIQLNSTWRVWTAGPTSLWTLWCPRRIPGWTPLSACNPAPNIGVALYHPFRYYLEKLQLTAITVVKKCSIFAFSRKLLAKIY